MKINENILYTKTNFVKRKITQVQTPASKMNNSCLLISFKGNYGNHMCNGITQQMISNAKNLMKSLGVSSYNLQSMLKFPRKRANAYESDILYQELPGSKALGWDLDQTFDSITKEIRKFGD